MAPPVMVVLPTEKSQNRILCPAMLPMLMRVALIFATLTCFVAPIHLSAQSSASLKALEGAAAKGNVAAMYALGSAAEADGDVEKALTHFRAAAEAGYAGAEFKLGECYEHGRGVPVDLTLAKDWYDKAAKQGLPQAIEKLNQLEANVEVPVTCPVFFGPPEA